MKIILGSQSKHRKKIMEDNGFEFEVMDPSIDEKAIRFEDPQKLTIALANAKADALLSRISEPVILITSDQVISWNGKILEKPENNEEARKFLRGYSPSQSPKTVTAVVVVNTETGKRYEAVDIAEVVFNKIPEEVINEVVENGDMLSRAGGFAIQNTKLQKYIKKINGTWDSITGLPIEVTKALMKQAGYYKSK